MLWGRFSSSDVPMIHTPGISEHMTVQVLISQHFATAFYPLTYTDLHVLKRKCSTRSEMKLNHRILLIMAFLLPLLAYYSPLGPAAFKPYTVERASNNCRATFSRIFFPHPLLPNLTRYSETLLPSRIESTTSRYPKNTMNLSPFPTQYVYMQASLHDGVHIRGTNQVYGWTKFVIIGCEPANWKFPTMRQLPHDRYGDFTMVAALHSGTAADHNQEVLLIWGMDRLRATESHAILVHLSTYHFIKSKNNHFNTFFSMWKPYTLDPDPPPVQDYLTADQNRNLMRHRFNFLLQTLTEIQSVMECSDQAALDHLVVITTAWVNTTTANIDESNDDNIRHPIDIEFAGSMHNMAVTWRNDHVVINSLRTKDTNAFQQQLDSELEAARHAFQQEWDSEPEEVEHRSRSRSRSHEQPDPESEAYAEDEAEADFLPTTALQAAAPPPITIGAEGSPDPDMISPDTAAAIALAFLASPSPDLPNGSPNHISPDLNDFMEGRHHDSDFIVARRLQS